jgi:hypothetical protein
VSPRAAPATLMVRSQVEPAGTALCLSSTAIWVRTSPRPCAPAERPGHTAREGSTLIHPTHIDTAELQTRVNALSLEQKVRLLTGADFWSLYPEPAAGLRRLVLSDGPAGVRSERWDERETSANVPSPTALAASWDDGAMSAAGAAVRRLRNAIFSDEGPQPREPDDYAWINAEAAKSVPGAGGVVFLPYLLGKRASVCNPDARGAWVGMSVGTGRHDLVRAVLESVGYGMRQLLEIEETQRGSEVGEC